MIDRVVMKSDMEGFLDELTAQRVVAAPVESGGVMSFRPVSRAGEVAERTLPSALPPRKFLTPPKDTLLTFEKHGGNITLRPVLEGQPVVLFNVPPCDLSALSLLDQLFDTGFRDGHYFARREQITVIGKECLEPCDEYSFCASMGTLEPKNGHDLLLTDLGDSYYVKIGTTKGKDLIDALPGTRAAIYEDRVKLRKAHERRDEVFANEQMKLDTTPDQLPALLTESYDSLLWDVLGEKCLSCGACNLACPTCYCFDIHDEVNLTVDGGSRYRDWDSCQLHSFAMVGTGESFRESRAMRQKHRFYRKGKYIMERYGRTACVGCGRCARNCLAGINPVEVYNQLKGQPVER